MSTHKPCTRQKYSCVRCATRKVKCDRNSPCAACTRHAVQCVFQPPKPPRARHRRLAERLKEYEAIIRENGLAPGEPLQSRFSEPAVTQSERPEHEASEPDTSRAQVIHSLGRFKLVDNILWTRMLEELHDPQDALEDPEDADSLARHPKSGHPPRHVVLQLWQFFVENVDPLTKILHVPTLRPVVEKAAGDTSCLSRSLEALLFSIYSAAVMSLDEETCQKAFDEPRAALLARYTRATEAALTRANYMGTTSLAVLQALLVHLFAVRDVYEPRRVWGLTGVAVRVAEGMGLDCDGTLLGLPPFEAEMRRRVWWQLRMHDFRTAELCGIPKFKDLHIDDQSPQWPANIDDDQLYPGMSTIPTKTEPITDTLFVAIKCDLIDFAGRHVFRNRQQFGPRPRDMDVIRSAAPTNASVAELQELLETKYLRHCDPSQPLELLSAVAARCSLNTVRFMAHHPRRWPSRAQTPLKERRLVWDLCIRLLEQHGMLQSNPLLQRFAWYAPFFQQWHAVIHMLDTLRAEPLHEGADRAWELIARVYGNNPDMASDMRKPIHMAVGNLCLGAYSNGQKVQPSHEVPLFIQQLRQHNLCIKRDGTSYLANSEPEMRSSSAPSHSLDPPLSVDIPAQNTEFLGDWMSVGWDQWDSLLADSNLMAPLGFDFADIDQKSAADAT